MEANEAKKLNDAQLKDTVGGVYDLEPPSTTDVYDTRGRCCGYIRAGTLYYYPCKKCGRPTHLGSGVHQCDKCDDWFFSISGTKYNGTVEELKAASAAN